MQEAARRTIAQGRARSGFASRVFASQAVLFAASVACTSGATGPPVRVIDLIKQFAHAEMRPLDGSFQIAEHTLGGRAHTSLVVPAPSRMIWPTMLPERATLRVAVAVPPEAGGAAVSFRIGISDDRVYDKLAERTLRGADSAALGWVDLEADLSLYAGRKISLFYRPAGRRWRIVLSVDAIAGTTAALWGAPGIETDSASARKYLARSP